MSAVKDAIQRGLDSDERHWAWVARVDRRRQLGIGPTASERYLICDECGHVTREPASACTFCAAVLS